MRESITGADVRGRDGEEDDDEEEEDGGGIGDDEEVAGISWPSSLTSTGRNRQTFTVRRQVPTELDAAAVVERVNTGRAVTKAMVEGGGGFGEELPVTHR